MPRPVTYNATLLEKESLSETLALFRIGMDEIPPENNPWFESGQYISLGLNVEEDPGKPQAVLRPYSIASEPEERRWLEFYIRRVSNPESEKPFTHMLWRLQEGERLYAGPRIAGRFTASHTVGAADTRLKVFVAAGTGLAPFVSMVRSHEQRGDTAGLRRLVVLHGASHVHELGYRERLEAARNGAGIRYLPTISRPQQNPDWTGHHGRVESFFEDGKIGDLEGELELTGSGLRPDKAVVYVCGFTSTITETLFRLIRRGFVPEDRRLRRMLEMPAEAPASLFFEQYDTEPLIDPKDEAKIAQLRADFRAHAAGS